MGKTKRVKKFKQVRHMLKQKDARIKKNKQDAELKAKNKSNELDTFDGRKIRKIEKIPTHLFFKYNSALGPPYRVLVDTNFINFSIKHKLDIFQSMMDCLLAKCTPIITDCVMAEIEKMGLKYRVALRIAKDPRFQRLSCDHKGTYADDCLVRRIQQHKIYIVATMDRDLRRRIRKVPGIPIMFIHKHRYSIERLPDVNNAPR